MQHFGDSFVLLWIALFSDTIQKRNMPPPSRVARARRPRPKDVGPWGNLGFGDLEFEFSRAFFVKLIKTRPGDCVTIAACIVILFYMFPPTRSIGLRFVYPSHNTTESDEIGLFFGVIGVFMSDGVLLALNIMLFYYYYCI